MEIKETSKLSMMNFLTKGMTSPSVSLSEDKSFLSLLDNTSEAPDFSKEQRFASAVSEKEPVSELKTKDEKDIYTKDKSEAKAENKTEAKDEKDDSSVKEDNENENIDEKEDDDKNQKQVSAVLPMPLFNLTNENMQVASAQTTDTQNLADVDTLKNGEINSLSLQMGSPMEGGAAEAVASEGNIKVQMQPVSEKKTLVENIQSDLPLQTEISADANVVPSGNLQDNLQNAEASVSSITAGKAKKENSSTSNNVQDVETLDVLSEEGEKISDLKAFGKDLNVDMDVEVNTEKFSYKDVSVSEKASLLQEQEVLKPQETKDASKNLLSRSERFAERQENAGTINNGTPQNVQAQNQTQAQSPAPMALAEKMPTLDVEKSVNIAKENVTEVKGINMAQIAGGSEFVNVSKARSAETIKSPSHDTYKGMSKEVAEQVKVNITKSAVKGVDKIDIQLKPEDLGKIEIKMHVSKNGRLQAEIVASNPETLDILQKDIQSLQKSFNDAGFQTDDNSFSFSYRGNSGDSQSGQESRNFEMRRFMGDVLSSEFNNDNQNGYLEENNWNGKTGLNIRV